MIGRKNDKPDSDLKNEFRPMLAASSVGFVFVISIVLGTMFGVWLDKQFNTKPYLTVLFLILGVVSGFRSMYIFIKRAGLIEKRSEQADEQEKNKESDQDIEQDKKN